MVTESLTPAVGRPPEVHGSGGRASARSAWCAVSSSWPADNRRTAA